MKNIATLIMTAVILSICCSASSAQVQSTPPMIPGEHVPDEAARIASLAKLKETFEDAYANPERDARKNLALTFLELAKRSDAGWVPSDRYVLFDEARSLSIAALDLPMAFTAIQALMGDFAVDAQQLRSDAVLAIAPNVRRPDAAGAASLALGLSREYLAAGDLHQAELLVTATGQLVKQSRDSDLKRELAGLEDALLSALLFATQLAESEQLLEVQPGNPEANRLLGLYNCFERGDFERGLPYLVRLPEGELQKAAAIDIAAPDRPAGRKNAGEAWYLWSKSQSAPNKAHALARAKHWCLLASTELTSFDLISLEAILHEIDTALEELSRGGSDVPASSAASKRVAVKRLQEARASYEDDMERLRVTIASALASSEASLADSSRPYDQIRLVQVRAAVEGFAVRGDYPLPPIMPSALQARVDKARTKCRHAFERCIRTLSGDKNKDVRGEVQQQLTDFELEPAGLYERMAQMPPPDTQAEVLGIVQHVGTWELEDNGLICLAEGAVTFGDPEWTDYDVSLTVCVKDVPPSQCSLFARFDGSSQCWELNAGGWGLSNRDLRPNVTGDVQFGWFDSQHRIYMPDIQPTDLGDTYSIGMRLRGDTVTVLLDGEEARVSSHPDLTQGRVGIRTSGRIILLDVEVRDPEGRLLWKGLPDICE